MTSQERRRFDEIAERVFESLPPPLLALMDEVPVIIDDVPSDEILRYWGLDPSEPGIHVELLGLHTGVPLTEQSVQDSGVLPPEVQLYRAGIIELAGGWSGDDADQRIAEEVRITLLHELGHHFGLEEDDLAELGYD